MSRTNITQHLAYLTSSDEFTGSIDKLVSLSRLSGSNAAGPLTSTLIRLETGDENRGGVQHVLAETMSFEPGTVIDGPFARVKVADAEANSESEFLVYYKTGPEFNTTINRG